MSFKVELKLPAEGQEVFMFCPEFSHEGYVVGRFENGEFIFDPHGAITEYVKEWLPLATITDWAFD